MNAPNPINATMDSVDGILKIAILAVGGQGGGVLTSWIEDLARSQGYVSQSTSVAGVAQRTGATIYYVEMARKASQPPVFSLAPSSGDVDIMIAAELMEAGRAIIRGFVTPDRTTLIASTHRELAVSEKMIPGDGIAQPDEVLAAAQLASHRFISMDLAKLAAENGSVISATLFGALAASDATPFPRAAFEASIRQGGKGVEASLRAFGAAYDRVRNSREGKAPSAAVASSIRPTPVGKSKALEKWNALVKQVEAMPAGLHEITFAGLRKTIDFMDLHYGKEYLGRLSAIVAQDSAQRDFALSLAAAKYIANAMCYDDVIRVADLKTRKSRSKRITKEIGQKTAQVLHLTEFMHPRAEEIVGLFPSGLGRRFSDNPTMMKLLDRIVNKGRRVRTYRLLPFVGLYALGGMKGWRRSTWRHTQEVAHLNRWIEAAMSEKDYALSVELFKTRRLIKGYSDTHSRGLTKFDKVMGAAELVRGREDAAAWIARLRTAALDDEEGKALDGALATIRSFV